MLLKVPTKRAQLKKVLFILLSSSNSFLPPLPIFYTSVFFSVFFLHCFLYSLLYVLRSILSSLPLSYLSCPFSLPFHPSLNLPPFLYRSFLPGKWLFILILYYFVLLLFSILFLLIQSESSIVLIVLDFNLLYILNKTYARARTFTHREDVYKRQHVRTQTLQLGSAGIHVEHFGMA